MPNELMSGPFCSVLPRFSSHSGSAWNADHFCSRSAIESQDRRLGGEVAAAAFVIDLPELGGAARLERDHAIRAHSLIAFDGH